MFEQFLHQFVLMGPVETISGWANRLPLPYLRLPVNVHQQRMAAHRLDRYLALWLWKLNLLERPVTRLLAQLCRPGMIVADVGANIGFYSLLMARQVGQTGYVWAFEPDPGNFAALKHNIQANGYRNISPINSAVGATSGSGQLYTSRAHNGDHRIYPTGQRPAIPIQMVALDQFFAPEQRLDLIKMDIQGAEGAALRGMQLLLRRLPHLVILMEFWPMGLRQAGSDPEAVLKDLLALGGTVERLDEPSQTFEPVLDPAALLQALTGKQSTHLLVTGAR